MKKRVWNRTECERLLYRKQYVEYLKMIYETKLYRSIIPSQSLSGMPFVQGKSDRTAQIAMYNQTELEELRINYRKEASEYIDEVEEFRNYLRGFKNQKLATILDLKYTSEMQEREIAKITSIKKYRIVQMINKYFEKC